MRILKMQELTYNNISNLADFFVKSIGALPYESLCAAFLDNKYNVIAVIELNTGSADTVSNSIVDILDCAAAYSSAKVVLCHNHPDGCIGPSDFDIYETRRLKKLLDNNGINLLEHIVVTDNSRSFLINGDHAFDL